MVVYGWSEQCEIHYGVQSREVAEFGCLIDDDSSEVYRHGLPGRWFTSFAAAKEEALDFWRKRSNTARRALSRVSELTSARVYSA